MWKWLAKAKRFFESVANRILGKGEQLDIVQESIDLSGVASDLFAGYTSQGALSAGDFRSLFREELKREYIRQYLIGIGGRGQMKPEDWGSVGGMLADQYRYMEGFLDEIMAGNLSEAQIIARARMYINSTREAFERAHGRNAEKLGMSEEKWIIDPAAENCPDCLQNASQGWQPIGTFPKPGSGATQCLTNCHCHLIYQNPDTGKQY